MAVAEAPDSTVTDTGGTPQPGGEWVPIWLRIIIALVGLAIVVYEVIRPGEPRWLGVLAGMVMAQQIPIELFDRWRRGP